MIPSAEKLAKLLDNRRIFQKEITAGKIRSEQFSEEERQIKIHGHCHQKSLSSIEATLPC
jgi:UDP-2,3-diacylglucosamine pyrophosphatase LpxH